MTKTKITFCQLLSRKSYSPLRSNAAAAAVCTALCSSTAMLGQHCSALCCVANAVCGAPIYSVAATVVTLQPFFEKRSFIEVKRDEKMQKKNPLSHIAIWTLGTYLLEPVCCKKQQKSPNRETGLGNRGSLEANDTKLILNDKRVSLRLI